MRAGRAVLAALGTGIGLAAACGGSGYQFVENDDLGVYAKVPDDWTIYDEESLFPDDSDRERERRAAMMWMRTFDASDEPSVEGSQAVGSGDPTGVVQVRLLTPQEREQVNVSTLRSLANNGQDPVQAARAEPRGDTQIVTDEPVDFEGGFHGVHTVFAKGQGANISVFDQTAVLDPTNTVLYLFVVTCDERCYFETSHDEITEIVDSWTIQEAS